MTPSSQPANPRGGPRTDAGKANSSRNSLTHGLFAVHDFIRPDEAAAYAELNQTLRLELAPQGLLESNLVDEIRRAMWRLRRCGEVEANLAASLDEDPMEADNPQAEKTQKSVDRARAHAHRLLHKCTAELRRLQTERHFAQEFFHEGADISDIGIADWRAITKAHGDRTRVELRQKKLDRLDNILAISQRCADEASGIGSRTIQTQSQAAKAA